MLYVICAKNAIGFGLKCALLLLCACLLTSCAKKATPEDSYQAICGRSLPSGARVLHYRTNFDRENDWLFAVEFQDEGHWEAFRAGWGYKAGISGKDRIFQDLLATISGTDFEKELVARGWSMSPTAYGGYEGQTKTGRDAPSFFDARSKRVLVFVPGG